MYSAYCQKRWISNGPVHKSILRIERCVWLNILGVIYSIWSYAIKRILANIYRSVKDYTGNYCEYFHEKGKSCILFIYLLLFCADSISRLGAVQKYEYALGGQRSLPFSTKKHMKRGEGIGDTSKLHIHIFERSL